MKAIYEAKKEAIISQIKQSEANYKQLTASIGNVKSQLDALSGALHLIEELIGELPVEYNKECEATDD